MMSVLLSIENAFASLIHVFTKYSGMFGEAMLMTLLLSVGTVMCSIILGSLVAFMKISKRKIPRALATAYVAFIRGTPLLVQIYIVFYGLPMLGIHLPSVSFMGASLDRFLSGLVALVINSTAYVCEIVRGGIQSIDEGQMEAARSIGFNKRQSMLYIVMPQAFKNILPAIGNEVVAIIKESSQVSVIGLAELMYTTNTIRAISFRSFEPLIIVSVLYFILTAAISFIVKKVEARLAVSNRSKD